MAKRRNQEWNMGAPKTDNVPAMEEVRKVEVVQEEKQISSELQFAPQPKPLTESVPAATPFPTYMELDKPREQFQTLKVLEQNVGNCLQIIDDEIMKSYVTKLSDLPIIEPDFDEEKLKNEPYQWFHITKLVYEKEEFSVSKLATVFQTVAGKNSTLVLMIQSKNNKTNFYIGVRNHDEKDFTGTLRQVLETSLKGQFPGSEFDNEFDINKMEEIKSAIQAETNSVSAVTCIPDFKQGKDFYENKDFLQGLEKFVISMQEKDYTAIFIADAVPYDELHEYRVELESVYTQLSPFANMQYQLNTSTGSSSSNTRQSGKTNTTTHGETDSTSTNNTSSRANTTGATDTTGFSDAHSINSGSTETTSKGKTVTDGTNQSTTEGESTTNTISAGTNANIGKFSSITQSISNTTFASLSANGSVLGAAIGSIIPGVGTFAGALIGKGVTGTIGKSVTRSFAKAVGSSVGFGVNSGVSHAKTKSHSETTGTSHSVGISDMVSKALTNGISDSKTKSSSHAVNNSTTDTETTGTSTQHGTNSSYSEAINFGQSETLTDTLGSSKGIIIQSQNLMISNMMERIKKQIERIDECESIGMWNSAAYFLSGNRATSEAAAAAYHSLISGEKSGVERSAINTWSTFEKLPMLKSYITHFSHPKFLNYVSNNDTLCFVSPASLVSTKELAIQMSLPRKSVCGLPVAEHAVFGQEVSVNHKNGKDDLVTKKLELGNIFHLNETTNMKVELDANSLTMHTFVTGSTGSGKSNTIYYILDKLADKKIPYLVIEPAKGEYKTKFKNANVFGTNPNLGELIQMNPFSFENGIHVQEHIDRLTELFNVCWPMYAAMPAVLKDSIIRAYESAGWDMMLSVNPVSNKLFPTFEDVLRELENVIDDSDYSGDTSSDYKGSLKTRLKSLTNGVNGMIFSSQEIASETLFNSNTIIDLSRVGSTETKSLMMGILVLKLQEYHMANQVGTDSELRHITVLEEAHNLLKKTSTEQGQETANLQGKSVEMLTNAIAEMRTYGEGFIIADQAPDLLDTAVIRNTNTKIVLRLPEGKDREITGTAMALNENQMQELSKLPTGVAAIYQNNWQEAVLCNIPKYKNYNLPANITPTATFVSEQEILKKLLSGHAAAEDVLCSGCPAKIRRQLIQDMKSRSLVYEWAMADFITNRFNWKVIFDGTNRTCSTLDELGQMMIENISPIFQGFSEKECAEICYYICRKAHEEFPKNNTIEDVRVHYFKEKWMK